MPGIAELALAGAPIAGGALLGIAAGNLRAPDLRETIKKDMELLESLPPEQVERRAELQRVIDLRVDDIIASVDKSRSMREAAMSYTGNWRDIVVFVCGVLFTIVWATAVDPTKRSNYWIMLVVLILATLVAGGYAARGAVRALRTYLRDRKAQ
jgi:hypothetical protein